jgi:hypothetical protein
MVTSGYKWSDYRTYGFICAGGGPQYRKIMEQLQEGNVIYAYVSKYGYVGIGTVTKRAVPFRKATLEDGRRLADLPLEGHYNDSSNDDEGDWIALVNWIAAVDKTQAVRESPFTVSTSCKIYEHHQTRAENIKSQLVERAKVNLTL